MNPPDYDLRPMTEDDVPFAGEVYISTRWEELAITGWSDEQKRAFLHSQHLAQHQHYRQVYIDATWSIIEQGRVPVGRLYRADLAGDIRVIDISLLPRARGGGIGSSILQAVQREATRTGRKVSIHVEKTNRARSLYARLGFRTIEDLGVYDFMTWSPPDVQDDQ